MWLILSLLGTLILAWLLAEWALWRALERHFKNLRFDEDSDVDSSDVRQGSSIGMVQLGPSGIFEVQEDGTVVGIAASRWSDESTSGRDDHE